MSGPSAETASTILDIIVDMGKYLFDLVRRGRSEEIRRLQDVWPEEIRPRLVLLEAEAEIRRRANQGG